MAKTVSKKSLEVKTPYPGEKKNKTYDNLGKLPPLKEKVKPDEINDLGNKLADLSDRINEVELSMESLGKDIKRVMGRMGL